MIDTSSRLIQFARYPVLGQVKTRLKGVLDEHLILRLHCQLVRYTNRELNNCKLAPVDFWYSSETPLPSRDTFLATLSARVFHPQVEGDLGFKMYTALKCTLAPSGSADYAVLVGSDCPFIDQEVISEALDALKAGVDVVLGPAEDGGYYLIGLSRPRREIFKNIPWGTSRVLDKTLQHIRHGGLDCHKLPELADIDVAVDLPKLAEKQEFNWLKNEYIL